MFIIQQLRAVGRKTKRQCKMLSCDINYLVLLRPNQFFYDILIVGHYKCVFSYNDLYMIPIQLILLFGNHFNFVFFFLSSVG